ncbi:MAG: 2-dehydropantoate 2-reductase [Chloroflexi bacterium]|nr:2-dehydropantoate 2-reductase [Chloroflexota bacterium]
MKIVIFGAGGVGSYFGARLAQAGEEVFFIARGAHLRAIQQNGLRVESILGDFVIQPAKTSDDPAEIGTVDLVILGVKAWQVPEAAEALKPLIDAQTIVLPLQNGVDAPSQLEAALGREHVLGGLCRISVLIAAPGVIRHVAIPPTIAFGELDPRPSARVESLRQVFARCQGLTVNVPPDINVALWEKFMFIASVSGLGAATRQTIGGFRSLPETRHLLLAALEEVAVVARAKGIVLADDAISRTLAIIDGLPPATLASMQNDITNGRPSELESQTGAVVRMGREAGVPTPVNEFLYAILLPMEINARRGATKVS